MAQYLFDRRLERRALQQNHRCFALIRFLGVVPTLHTKFWQPAGHGPVRSTAVHVLPSSGAFSRSQAALPHVILSVNVRVVFLPSPDERIRSIGTRGGRSHIWQKPGTCFGNLIAWFPFTFHTPSLRNSWRAASLKVCNTSMAPRFTMSSNSGKVLLGAR